MPLSPPSESPIERYTRGVIRWRWPVLLASLALAIGSGMGIVHLKFIDEYRVFFGPDNPQLLAFDAVENIYTKNDNIFFIVEPPGDHDDAFSPETLAIVEHLTEEAWRKADKTKFKLIERPGDFQSFIMDLNGNPITNQSFTKGRPRSIPNLGKNVNPETFEICWSCQANRLTVA